MRNRILTALALLLGTGCNRPHPQDARAIDVAVALPPDSVSVAAPAAPIAPSEPASPWKVFTSHDESTGEDIVTAISYGRNLSLIVRQTGKKLTCYITNGDPLESMDNMPHSLSHVKYGFDEGEMATQDWIVSDRKTALFYPGNVREFIQNLRKARRFVIEYRPSGAIPETTTFDVSLFPYAAFRGSQRTG